jgi:phospholipid N-methyltransferase
MTDIVKQTLQSTIIVGNVVKLPDVKLDRKEYLEVAKALELIGGKWDRKNSGFIFDFDPTSLLHKVQDGESINLKKEYQFYETPEDLADRLVSLVNIKTEDKVLEPSAGRGAIIKAINKKYTNPVSYYELMDINRTFLDKIEANYLGDDFMTCTEEFDCIIANPPFSKNQDIDHIMKMYQCLKKGGTIISIMSKHWTFANDKKSVAFRDFMQNHTTHEIEEGAFKDSGTMVSSIIVEITKY